MDYDTWRELRDMEIERYSIPTIEEYYHIDD